jgi:hypothetical protein
MYKTSIFVFFAVPNMYLFSLEYLKSRNIRELVHVPYIADARCLKQKELNKSRQEKERGI